MNNNILKNKRSTPLFFKSAILTILFFPVVALAAVFTDFASLVDFIIITILTPLIYLIVGAAVVYFMWGVSNYILHGGDIEKRKEGYKMMIYGIIAIFVMVSVWGFVRILLNTFGF
jgi:hypothetical protein